MAKDDLRTIAAGGQPVWEQTYPHPQHGDLTFRAKLPRARDLMQHTCEIDNQIAELNADPTQGTMLFAASIAGIKTLMEKPCIKEDREEDPEDPDHVKVTRTFYDPEEEFDEKFVVQVWTDFSAWRRRLVERVDELGNSSGGTVGSASSAPSNAPTVSPSTMAA